MTTENIVDLAARRAARAEAATTQPPAPRRDTTPEAHAFGDLLREMARAGQQEQTLLFPGDQSVADLCAMFEEMENAGWAVRRIMRDPDDRGLVLGIGSQQAEGGAS